MKVFFPLHFEDVEATPPHPEGTAYRVALGTEHWAEGQPPATVFKVQLVRDGHVIGRRSPSYPAGSDDFERVVAAMQRVKAGWGRRARGKVEAF